MKILADENFPRPIVEVLRGQGHDILWARTDCPGLKDRTLLEHAEAAGPLVLTLDKDFSEVLAALGSFHTGGPAREWKIRFLMVEALMREI